MLNTNYRLCLRSGNDSVRSVVLWFVGIVSKLALTGKSHCML